MNLISKAPGPARPLLRARTLFLLLVSLLATVPALTLIITTGAPAQAHGTPMKPGSRTFLCWQDALTDTGEIKPVNPACRAAQQVSGTTPFYNWFSVLRSDGAGRTRGFVPDGALCSGGNPNFTGFDQPRADWPVTHLTSGATVDFSYNAWAAHPGWFRVYLTKDGFDPTRTLTWDALEDQPFLTADHPPLNGTPGRSRPITPGPAGSPRESRAATSSTWSGSARTARRPSTPAPTSSSTAATAR
ncbi:hypothetical protein GCM10018783_16370 [Streptomyces griseosporeus]|nr:hypothetical protein GCM10018783_16370 [Streptomyces griseosporeus]